MRPKNLEGEKREILKAVMLTQDEAKALEQTAQKEGLAVSQFIRRELKTRGFL